MAWDFSVETEFQQKIDWMRSFVDEHVEPLDLLWPGFTHTPPPPWLRKVIDPLKQQVRDRGLWACHLTPELGGQGYGQLQLSFINEVLGRTKWGPTIFGCQGPDTGNAEIIAHYGTVEQRAKYLQPLLDGEMFSCFSMTEPQGGSDPTRFTTRAVRDGDEWVISGEKWFSSNASGAEFFIVVAKTDMEVDGIRGLSMFFVPKDAAGLEVVRHVHCIGEEYGGMGHAYLRYDEVRVPLENMLGPEGEGFVLAQTRLGGGRLHHAMRTIGVCEKAMEMMLERALSRDTHGGSLAEKQMVQHQIAESFAQLEQFRLYVRYTAWLCDHQGTARSRKEIATCKNLAGTVQHDIVYRAVHLHGSLGVTNETPLGRMWSEVPWMGVMDGPTEAHEVTVARQLLKDARPAPGTWPTSWIPGRLDEARERHAAALTERAEHERLLAGA